MNNNTFNVNDKINILTSMINYKKDLYLSKDIYTSIVNQLSTDYKGLEFICNRVYFGKYVLITYVFNGTINNSSTESIQLHLSRMTKVPAEDNSDDSRHYDFLNRTIQQIFELLPNKLSDTDIKNFYKNKELYIFCLSAFPDGSNYVNKFYSLLHSVVPLTMKFTKKAYQDISFNFNS